MNKVSIYQSLNGLRGFAVLLVLLSHSSNNGVGYSDYFNFSGAGRYGVFLFFVLSSFLLTKQLLNTLTKNNVRNVLTHYFIRRILRIYPLFVASLVTYYLLNILGYPLIKISEIDILKSILLLDGKDIFWTIAVEFQYYFILPLVVMLLLKINNLKIILAISFLFVSIWSYLFPPKYVTHIIPFLSIFLIGSIGAFLSDFFEINGQLNKYRMQRILNIISICSFVCFFVFTPVFFNIIFDEHVSRTHFHFQFIFFGLISMLLTLSIIHGNGIIKKLMECNFLTFWGKVSFSAYLGHRIILFAVPSFSNNSLFNLFIFLIITALMSFISYQYFELPLSKIHNLKSILTKIDNTDETYPNN